MDKTKERGKISAAIRTLNEALDTSSDNNITIDRDFAETIVDRLLNFLTVWDDMEYSESSRTVMKNTDKYFCAKCLQHILTKFMHQFSYAETSGMVCAISILFDEPDMMKWDYSQPDIEKMFWGRQGEKDAIL